MLLEIAEVGRDDVHAEQFGIGNIIPASITMMSSPYRNGHGVHPELAQPADRDDLQLPISHRKEAQG